MVNLEKILKEVIDDARQAGIPIASNIYEKIIIDYSATKTMGMCHMLFDRYEIHISQKVLGAKRHYIKNIIAHEVLHTCFMSMHHVYPWLEYSKIMNETYNYDIRVKYSWEDIELEG